METKFNFNSQVCTDKNQSERLLALGLKKETADMVLLKEMVYDENNHCTRDGDNYLIRPIDYIEGEEHRGHIPAWSLHRLLELCTCDIDINIFLSRRCFWINKPRNDPKRADKEGGVYDGVIDYISLLIKEGYFNKEYLV